MVAILHTSLPMVVRRPELPCLSTNKRRKKAICPTRKVQFNDNKNVVEIASRASFTRDELNSLYFSKSEHTDMQMEILEIIRHYRLCQDTMDSKQLDRLRGLESITNHDDKHRTSRLKGAVLAVMERQQNGIIDEMWLSTVYRPYSESAHALARERAEKDSQAAFSDVPRMIVMCR